LLILNSFSYRHFTIRGAEGTDFAGGVYHGRILLPPEYPFKPPHIMFLTPSGRFETGTKVCLSFSAYHPELWQPAWGIRLILEALISFLPTPADGAIGALDWTSEERKRLAKKSVSFCCPRCGPTAALLPEPKEGDDEKESKPRFAKEIEKLRMLQAVNESKHKDKSSEKEAEKKDAAEEDEVAPLVQEQQSEPSVAPAPAAATTAATVNETTPVVEPAAEPVEEQPANNETEETPEEFTDAAEPEPSAEAIDWSFLTDRFVNNSIAIMSLLLYLLWRKGCALFAEIQEVNRQLQHQN
jgi:ubiquitin-conjugating enzyme E2 J1